MIIYMKEGKSYEDLYKGAHRGDTWTLPENSNLNPRLRAVEMVRSKFEGPVRILDIGCGKAINTKWIADNNDGSSWVGIDVISKEKMGLRVENDKNHRFIEGNIFSKDFRKTNNLEKEKFDIIVDQGTAFLEIDNPTDLDNYLKMTYNLLNNNGILIILSPIGKPQVVIFPDGRKRVFRSPEDFQKEPFNKYFGIEKDVQNNIFTYGGYSYLPDFDSKESSKNPMSTKVGDELQLQIAQIPLRKKPVTRTSQLST